MTLSVLAALAAAALSLGGRAEAQDPVPSPEVIAAKAPLTPEDLQALAYPWEIRVAALVLPSTHKPGLAKEALRRCQAGDFSVEPMPAHHSHGAPQAGQYRDLGFLAPQAFAPARRKWLKELSRATSRCILVKTARGPVVLRRMMQYPRTQRSTQDLETYRRRVNRQRVVLKLRQQVLQQVSKATGRDAGVARTSASVINRRGMVRLKGGIFWVGSTDKEIDERVELFKRYLAKSVGAARRTRYSDEVRRPAQVGPFALDRTEVTLGQYRRFLSRTGYKVPGISPGAGSGANLPMTHVSLTDAMAYCAWVGARLPTVWEWEYAARGLAGRRYPWGATAPDGKRANFCERRCKQPWANPDHDDGFSTLAPVGSFPAGATPEGILDMSGNAREWTSTLLPDGRAMVKGGGYNNAIDDMVAADVRANPHELRSDDIGFRCAADVQGK